LRRDGQPTDSWFLQGPKAQLACGPLLADLDVEQPMLGLQNLRLPNEMVDGRLMGVDVKNDSAVSEERWKATDVYTRGSDLVASYREPASQPFHLQVYWRVLEPREFLFGAFEAIVSIQTLQWEAYPYVTIRSALDVAQARRQKGGVSFLSRHDWSYVEASPSGDFDLALEESSPGLTGARWSYGNRFMERGVIRRLRLRGAFAPIANAEDAIEQILSEFASEPPPLTA
jgi:hypothetical protein